MSTETQPIAPQPATEVSKKRRFKVPRKPSAPRVMDPEIVALRKAHNANVKALHTRRASAKLLATILNKRLAQMTQDDRSKLFDALAKTETPKLLP